MRKFRFLPLLALVATIGMSAVSCGEKDNPDDDPKTEDVVKYPIVKKDQVLKSTVLGTDVQYNVVLPGSWEAGSTKTYPIIYLLHGASFTNVFDEYRGWTDKTSLASKMFQYVKDKNIEECIVVTPQAWNSFYMNSGDVPYESFFFDEFMPFMEKEYHASSKRGETAIAGLSMGGYGTFYYTMFHPEKFCYAFSMSMPDVSSMVPGMMPFVKKDQLPYIQFVGGTTDYTVGEGPLNTYNACLQEGVDCGFFDLPGGHDWTFWNACIDYFIPAIGKQFKKEKQAID